MAAEMKTIDVWMQHPTLKFISQPMFDSLRRWTGADELKEEVPVEWTIAAMDEAGVRLGLICAYLEAGLINRSVDLASFLFKRHGAPRIQSILNLVSVATRLKHRRISGGPDG